MVGQDSVLSLQRKMISLQLSIEFPTQPQSKALFLLSYTYTHIPTKTR
jgi:hypothetical protein